MIDIIKRRSGGQPGNQNARKHGLYSKVLTREEKRGLKYANAADGLDQELAVLRLKFTSLLALDGQNVRLINQSAATLAKLYQIKYGLSRNDSSILKAAVASVLEEFIIPGVTDSDNSPSNPSTLAPARHSEESPYLSSPNGTT
jgi:hypothetical protein